MRCHARVSTPSVTEQFAQAHATILSASILVLWKYSEFFHLSCRALPADTINIYTIRGYVAVKAERLPVLSVPT